MKTRNIILLALAALTFSLPTDMLAQDGKKSEKHKNGKNHVGVDRRDQADGWYLPVKGAVTFKGQPTDSAFVQVFQENGEIGKYPVSKKGTFTLELDLDSSYTLYVTRPGCQPKIISLDTHLPKEQVKYPAYECFVDLEPADKTAAVDDFYLDFPSAVVRYDSTMGGYYHSEAYLTHINNKLQRIAQASF